MDVLFTVGMLVLMAGAIVVLGRVWPRSSRGGGYRAGRGYGAGNAGSGATGPVVAETDDAGWRWGADPAVAGPGSAEAGSVPDAAEPEPGALPAATPPTGPHPRDAGR
jgi:hypothetical protein